MEIARLCKYRLLLNGTPISRNEADLFGQWYILDWRILGYQSYWSFAANHLEYDEKFRGRIRRVLHVDYLTDKIAPYSYMVKKDECMELPDKIGRVRYFDLTRPQLEEYEWTKERYLETLLDDEGGSAAIYRAFTALQQVSSGRRIVSRVEEKIRHVPMFDDPMDNPRMDALMQVVEGIGGKAVIWCKYAHEIGGRRVLLARTVRAGRGGGIPRRAERGARAGRSWDAFRADARFLVANRVCAGFGLNLQFCHQAVYYDNDWDWATRAQSEDRLHRYGQAFEVEIFDLCARSKIDERILQCLSRKESLADWFRREIKNKNAFKWVDGEDETYDMHRVIAKKRSKSRSRRTGRNIRRSERCLCFSPKRFWLAGESCEQYEWADIIMYKVFYPLLERIDDSFLIVINECLRVRNRNDLTYNCLHHYLNQTRHRIVFEYFPFIEDAADTMILLDNDKPNRFKGSGYDRHMLADVDLDVTTHHYSAYEVPVALPTGAADRYAAKKQALLDGLGNGDPDTVPRQLHVWCGAYKRGAIEPEAQYVARNARFDRNNIVTYPEVSRLGQYVVIDFPHRRLDFNDFLKISGMTRVEFLSTGLGVDRYYYDEFNHWERKVGSGFMLKQVYISQNVVDAARARIAYIFDEFRDIIVSVSGGKDSTVLCWLALEEARRRGRKIGIFFIDEEAVYQSTVEQVEWLMNLYPENTIRLWLQFPFRLTNATSVAEGQLICWEEGKHQIWMRPKLPYAIQHMPWPRETETARDKNKGFGFYDVIENFQRQRRNTAFLVGLRAVESMNRFRAVSKNPGYKDVFWATKCGGEGSASFYPLYDWNFHDIWKFVYDNGIRYSRIYDYQFKKGMGIQEIRVSSLIHEKSFKALVELPEFEPKTYDRLCKRIKGIQVGHLYGKDAKMAARAAAAKELRELAGIPRFPAGHVFGRQQAVDLRAALERQLDNNYVARQQCRQLILNDLREQPAGGQRGRPARGDDTGSGGICCEHHHDEKWVAGAALHGSDHRPDRKGAGQ